jgi:hypothetical protein
MAEDGRMRRQKIAAVESTGRKAAAEIRIIAGENARHPAPSEISSA